MNEYEQAMSVLARSAGDELEAFFGHPRVPVSEEAVMWAGRVMVREMRAEGLMEGLGEDEDELARVAAEEGKADALECFWHVRGPKLKTQEARLRLLAFIESRIGRPVRPPDY